MHFIFISYTTSSVTKQNKINLRNIMFQRVEQADRAAQAPITQVKIKGGRSKVVKMKDETRPTPQGRRVVPRITSAMKDQAVKKGGTKKGKLKVCVMSAACHCV